jgi:ABC-type lipoprotein export system ATPase subunit
MTFRLENILPVGFPQNVPKETVWNTILEIRTRDTHILTGTSGRGKSTFLHILSGIRKDFSGILSIDGINTAQYAAKKWAELRQDFFAIVFQDLRLIPHLTPIQNFTLKTNLTQGTPSKQIESYAERLEIQECLHKRCSKLSFGQQQRVAIIRALIQPFRFLLLDEPFSHLDPENTQRSLDLIKEVADQNDSGILLTTLNDDHGVTPDRYLAV